MANFYFYSFWGFYIYCLIKIKVNHDGLIFNFLRKSLTKVWLNLSETQPNDVEQPTTLVKKCAIRGQHLFLTPVLKGLIYIIALNLTLILIPDFNLSNLEFFFDNLNFP